MSLDYPPRVAVASGICELTIQSMEAVARRGDEW
jgi:hypothetical protein